MLAQVQVDGNGYVGDERSFPWHCFTRPSHQLCIVFISLVVLNAVSVARRSSHMALRLLWREWIMGSVETALLIPLIFKSKCFAICSRLVDAV